jgi:hypothetical protein
MRKHTNERAKRKYGDKRKAATESNRTNRPSKHADHLARMALRTDALEGQPVRVRIPGYANGLVGTVAEIMRKGDPSYPTGAKRSSGAYLLVRTNAGDRTVSRHRVKPVKKDERNA